MTSWLQRNILLFVVFLTGAALLVIEVVATRVLSPYYGNTIYTFSSVLGVVLAFLSLGYVLGGRMADRHPDTTHFYSIILASGCSVALLGWMTVHMLPRHAYAYSLTTGPLLFSLILFALPSVLIGMLSPYVITLQKKSNPKTGLGEVAGNVFFFSTMGSILGSIGTGFVLIPYVGVQEIIVAVAVLLIAIGSVGVLPSVQSKAHAVRVLLVIIMSLAVACTSFAMPENPAVVFSDDGTYERIRVYELPYEGRPARVLFLDRTSSTARYLDGDDLLFPYTHFLKFHELLDAPDRALVLGAGGFVIPEALHARVPDMEIDVVDIEPKLFDVGKQYFGFTDPPEIHSYTEDGRRFLHDSPHAYDLIFGDVFSSGMSIPSHMATQEFFQLAYDRLDDGGVFIGNFIGPLHQDGRSLIPSLLLTFQSVFDHVYVFRAPDTAPDSVQNIEFIGFRSRDERIDFCDTSFTEHDDTFFHVLCETQVDLQQYDVSNQILLTDNFAPIERLTATWTDKVR